MEITKAQWQNDGENVRLVMPISKVDGQNRLVSGWASLDNVDSQGDIILPEANRNAFARFRGNIREMHQPIAVGKMVSFREDTYFDPATEEMYNGIFVTVYVSTGAEDTWQKVLDGTLQGFSIGGAINDASSIYMQSLGKSVRVVSDYDLIELSLVDSPANQLANIFSITKSSDGVVWKGMVTDVITANVFYCPEDNVATSSTEDSAACPHGHRMQNIGWFESDGGDSAEKMRDIVAKHIDSSNVEKQANPANNEGGVNVAEENDAVVETEEVVDEVVVDEPVVEETVAETATEEVVSEEDVEKAADVSEVEGDTPDFEKMFGDLRSAIESGLSKAREDAEAAIAKATESFEVKLAEIVDTVKGFEAKHTELTNKFDSFRSELDSVEKRVDGVESDTAVKKSGDLGGSTEDGTLTKSKSVWGGRFLSSSEL